jgi:hypothetical protein
MDEVVVLVTDNVQTIIVLADIVAVPRMDLFVMAVDMVMKNVLAEFVLTVEFVEIIHVQTEEVVNLEVIV